MLFFQPLVCFFFLITAVYANPAPAVAGKMFTMTEVRSQKLTILSGNVYNLSDFARIHMGGQYNIQSIMGMDGTMALRDRHGLGFISVVQRWMVGTLARN
jgi:hypothetical protein